MNRKGKIIKVNKVDEKLKTLSNKTFSKFRKSLLQQNNSLNTLDDTHNQLLPPQQINLIGNIGFICQQLYALVVKKDLGLDHNNTGTNKTYISVNKE